jgi:SAM domain (Sterile alpha motif)
MRQVAEWLEQLGMSEYTPCFAQNDIDFLLLPELTDQDLEKIGVASLGHRRKILKAIVALNGGKSAEPPAVLEPTHSVPPQPAAVIWPAAREPAGERRYVTVMFCDLVGSTGISAQLDALMRVGGICSRCTAVRIIDKLCAEFIAVAPSQLTSTGLAS